MKNRVIWKFVIRHGVETVVSIPREAPVRLAGKDPASGDPAIWVEVPTPAEAVARAFVVVATGQKIEGDGGFPYDLHVGSYIDAPYVWHIYERRA